MGLKQILKKIVPEKIKFYIRLQLNRIKYRNLIKITQNHYKEVIKNLKNRKNLPLRFAAYVVFDSTFGAYEIIELMLADLQHYSPKIVICPDTSRGEDFLEEQYKKTKDFFVKKYGSEYVIDGYQNGCFIDVSDQFDVVYLANPYDHMVNTVHSVRYLSTKNLLPIYITYCFQPNKYTFGVMSLLELSLFWKVFTDTKYTFNEYRKYELLKGCNVVLTGFAKMDSISKIFECNRSRKRVILAPHHTINNPLLPLSNFLKFKDYILELPKKFPNIDFVFRPHPLLFVNMINEGIWTKNDRDLYIEQLKNVGIEYSLGGDYFVEFVNSDALIHDCSSFMVEYLFLDKPCCFIVKDNTKDILSKLGLVCLKCHDQVSQEYEIEEFIENLQLEQNNIHLNERKKALKKIKINYPNVSKKILEIITFEKE